MRVPKISIITPSYNQGDYIEDNILSVIGQNYDNIEHIIVDGGSSDKTISILKRYKHLKWVSEKDEGQADALNKGLALATGDLIGWINSDDYYEKNVFQDVLVEFKNAEVKWVIGNISFEYMLIGKKVLSKSLPITVKSLLKNPDILRQQGAFFRRSFLVEQGAWNKDFHLIMDLDLWLRLSKASIPKMIDKKLAVFRMQPDQKTSGKNLLRQLREMGTLFEREKADAVDYYSICLKKYYFYFKDIIKQALIRRGFLNEVYANIPVSTKKLQ